MDHHAMRTAAGALGGLLGTAFIQQSMKMSTKLPDSIKPPMPAEDPGEFMVKQGEKLIGHPLEPSSHGAIAHGLHWVYGGGWAALLGAVAPELRIKKLSHVLGAGAALGAVVWAAGALGWMPATHLTPPVTRQRPLHVFMNLMNHVVYGALSALPLYAVNRFEERRGIGRINRVLHSLAHGVVRAI